MIVKSCIYLNIKQFNSSEFNRCFGRAYWFHHQDRRKSQTRKQNEEISEPELTCFSESPVDFHELQDAKSQKIIPFNSLIVSYLQNVRRTNEWKDKFQQALNVPENVLVTKSKLVLLV